MRLLAFNSNCNKMICRRCYARLNKRATKCRKCSSVDLRIKKKMR